MYTGRLFRPNRLSFRISDLQTDGKKSLKEQTAERKNPPSSSSSSGSSAVSVSYLSPVCPPDTDRVRHRPTQHL